jgi:hypothetical protein
VRTGIWAAFVGALAAAAAACDAFALPDVSPPAEPAEGGLEQESSSPCIAGSLLCVCAPESTLVSRDAAGVVALRSDGAFAYWIGGAGATRGLYRSRLDGDGGAPAESMALAGALSAGDLAVDAIYAYVVEASDAGASGASGPAALARVPLGGGTLELFAAGLPQVPVDLSIGPEALFWTDESAEICRQPFGAASPPDDSGCGSQPLAGSFDPTGAPAANQLAVAGSNVYIAVGATGDIWRVSAAGGDAGAVASAGPGAAAHLAATPSDAFWVEYDARSGSRIVEGPGSWSVPLPDDLVTELKADDTNLYWVAVAAPRPNGTPLQPALEQGQIWAVSQSGDALPRLVACDVHGSTLLALDSTYLVWADPVTGEVRRVPK